jgi:DNA (cytosine-5)-methyltransferase 1
MLGEGLRAGLGYLGRSARAVGYVERDTYAASVLVARMEEASLDRAPIWDDIATFDGRPWRGQVDCFTAGFPCQPWSAAGKQKGKSDERWIWGDVERVIREIDPPIVFLENVRGLVSGGGLESVLTSLSDLGFDAEWDCVRASNVGAAHRRERVFILAYTKLARSQGNRSDQPQRWHEPEPCGGDGGVFALGPQDQCWGERLISESYLAPAIEPGLRLLADGLAVVLDESRADQLRCGGNGVVAIQAAVAFITLARRAEILTAGENIGNN